MPTHIPGGRPRSASRRPDVGVPTPSSASRRDRLVHPRYSAAEVDNTRGRRRGPPWSTRSLTDAGSARVTATSPLRRAAPRTPPPRRTDDTRAVARAERGSPNPAPRRARDDERFSPPAAMDAATGTDPTTNAADIARGGRVAFSSAVPTDLGTGAAAAGDFLASTNEIVLAGRRPARHSPPARRRRHDGRCAGEGGGGLPALAVALAARQARARRGPRPRRRKPSAAA